MAVIRANEWMQESIDAERSKFKNLLRRKGENAVYEALRRQKIEKVKKINPEGLTDEEYKELKRIYSKEVTIGGLTFHEFVESLKAEIEQEYSQEIN